MEAPTVVIETKKSRFDSAKESYRKFKLSIRHLLGVPDGKAFIWWLVEKYNSPKAQILAFIGFIIFFRISQMSWSLTLAMILGMYLHEWGHALVFNHAKIKSVTLLLFPLGAIAAPANEEENKRSDELPWDTLAYLLHAGPAVNVFLMLAGLVLQLTPIPIVQTFGRDLVFGNGMLAGFNLIPWKSLDAGQLFKLIFASLKKEHDQLVAWFLTISAFLTLLVITIFPLRENLFGVFVNVLFRYGWVSFLILFVAAAWHTLSNDKPELAESAQAMTHRQVALHTLLYVFLVGITLWFGAGALW